MSTVQRFKFLWDAAMTMNASAGHVNNLLKSSLRNSCRKLAGTNAVIPLERFAESQMCKHCLLHWQENDFEIKYDVQDIQITTNKAKKLINKLTDVQDGKIQNKLLTKKQKMRAKWLQKRAKTRLVIVCKFCQHKTFIALEKPNKLKNTKDIIIKDPIPTTTHTTKKKGKKIKTKPNERKSDLQLSTVKVERPLKNNLNPKKTSQAKVAAKQVKKPQQKNSLLQLAALLKSQDNSKSQNKNRLESFLK